VTSSTTRSSICIPDTPVARIGLDVVDTNTGTHTRQTSARPRSREVQRPEAPGDFFCWKHERHRTGRPCVGLNGTVVSRPHEAQVAVVSTRSRGAPGAGPCAARFALQARQRFGSLRNPLSAKNACSPAVQMKLLPQSTHCRVLSWNSIGPLPSRPCSAGAGGLLQGDNFRRLTQGGGGAGADPTGLTLGPVPAKPWPWRRVRTGP